VFPRNSAGQAKQLKNFELLDVTADTKFIAIVTFVESMHQLNYIFATHYDPKWKIAIIHALHKTQLQQ